MQLPAVQQTPPSQLGAPVHRTLQATPAQLTRLAHALIPPQPIVVVAALLETSAAHERSPAQSTVQAFPLHVIGCLQVSAVWQRRSHDVASHAIAPAHESAPAQTTLHLAPPQAIPCLHEPAPTQSMTHELAALQSIALVQEPAPMQVTAQGMPAGQTMGSSHVPAAVHVMAQVPLGSQVPTPASAQREGHASAALIGGASAASPASTASPTSTASRRDVSASCSESDVTASSLSRPSEPSPTSIAAASLALEPSSIVTSGKEHAAANNKQALPAVKSRRPLVVTPRAYDPFVPARERWSSWRGVLGGRSRPG